MTEKMDKKWTTPQLIQLVRGGEEEGVLGVCKYYMTGGPIYRDCVTYEADMSAYTCFAYSPS